MALCVVEPLKSFSARLRGWLKRPLVLALRAPRQTTLEANGIGPELGTRLRIMDAPETLEGLLAVAIAEALEGRTPDFAKLAGGCAEVARELEVLLQDAMRFVPSVSRPSLPPRIGPWLIDREIGRGGMGTVFAAVHERTGEWSALKVLPRPFAFLPESRERFRREGLALSRIQHSHVVPILDVGEHDGIPFVCMQLVERGSLADLLRATCGLEGADARHRLAELLGSRDSYELRIARLFAGVAEALAVIHAAGMVHRDVKPSNLLLGPDGELLLSDFGLAQQDDLTKLTRSSIVVGTPQYLAPELTRSGSTATPASDLYALGVSLYEFLAFRPPFSGVHEGSLLRVIREAEPRAPTRWNPKIPRDLETICLRSMEKRPQHRYRSAQEMARDLMAVAEQRPIVTRRTSRMRTVTRRIWARRHAVIPAVGALLVLGTTTLGIARWREVRSESTWNDFVKRFQEAQVRLVNDYPAPKEVREPPLRAAAALLETCTQLQPDCSEAWLVRADVAVRLGLEREAREFLDRAVATGGDGWYLQDLRRQTSGRAGVDETKFPMGDVARLTKNFRPIERIALGAGLYHAKRYRDVFELLSDPEVLRDPLVTPDLLLAVSIHYDAVCKPVSEPSEIFTDRSSAVRQALTYYDRFLARGLGEQPLTEFNRAILIRDAVIGGYDLGSDRERRLDDAEHYFRRQLDSHENAENLGHWIAMLRARGRWSEAAETVARAPREWLLAMDEACFEASLIALIAAREYALAWDYLTRRPAGQSGPFLVLVALHERGLQAGAAAFDGEGILAFAQTHEDQITVDDLGQGLELLDALQARFPPSSGEAPR